jgi:Na+/phosphate symporter
MRIDLFFDSVFEFLTDPFGIKKRKYDAQMDRFIAALEENSRKQTDALLRDDYEEVKRLMRKMDRIRFEQFDE